MTLIYREKPLDGIYIRPEPPLGTPGESEGSTSPRRRWRTDLTDQEWAEFGQPMNEYRRRKTLEGEVERGEMDPGVLEAYPPLEELDVRLERFLTSPED